MYHNHLPTLYPVPLEISGQLSLMAKPLGGEDLAGFIQGLKTLKVDMVVSLLETHEQYTLGLSQQAAYCVAAGLNYLNFPIPDRGLPARLKAIELAKQLLDKLKSGEHVVIHCRAGIGRTSLIAGAVLILLGLKPEAALKHLSQARGLQVPDTEEQAQWLFKLPVLLQTL